MSKNHENFNCFWMKTAVGPREEFIIKKKTRCKVTHLKTPKTAKRENFSSVSFW
jgi:hypothetical protein